jgi:flavin-dependent dehydrogenase
MNYATSKAASNSSAHSPDIFIVGGGPAGLATAILAAKRGLHVAVADHNVFPIDKACGEGLMPDTLAALKTLGIDLGHGEATPFRGIRFREAESANYVEAEFGESFGLGIRRTVLHAKLAERAAEVGVVLLWGSRVTLNGDGRILCQGEPVRSKWVIGADGEASPFRKWAALDAARHEHIRFAARQHFQITPWTDFVEVYWGRDCQITVAAIAPEELCVAVTSHVPGLRFRDALERVPALASRLRNLPRLGKLRGARAASRRLRRVYRDRLALVGDASGSVDPLTGEGIGLAFKQAAALVEAITRNDLRAYQAAHDGIGKAPRLMSRFVLTMDAHPNLRRKALSILASEPPLFSRLLQFNVGKLALSRIGAGHALRFGWRMLAPGWEV